MDEKEREEILVELQKRTLPHTCETCWWMQPRDKPPLKGQKFCKYPGAIKTEGSSCIQWKLEEDPSRRSVGGRFVDGGF